MNKHKKQVTVAVVGVGHWGPNIIRNFAANSQCDVRWVCDTQPKNLAKAEALRLNGVRMTTDLQDVLRDPEVDAVAVVSPAATHAAIVRAALEADKHVFCEKPMAFDPEQALDLAQLAERKGRKLMVGYTFLYNAGVHKMKAIIEAGHLGQIYYLTATRTHLGLIREDVDVIWDLAPHDIAIMNYLLGEAPERVAVASSSPLNGSRCDVAFLSLYYKSGVIGQIHVSWLAASKVRQIQVAGSQARALFDDLDAMEPVRLFMKGVGVAENIEADFGNFRYLVSDGDIISPKVQMSEPLKSEIASFVAAVLDNAPLRTDGAFAAGITQVLAAANRSMALGGAPIEVR